MFPVKLFTALLVNNVTVSTLNEPSKLVNSPTLLVNVETLLRLKQLWDCPTTLLFVLEIKIAHEIVGVEVELFDAEWGGNFAFVVNICRVEHLLIRVVLQNFT